MMGWQESPPTFTSDTETITDLANVAIKDGIVPGPYRLEGVAETKSDVTTSPGQKPRTVDPRKW
jgi:hypothetical protein